MQKPEVEQELEDLKKELENAEEAERKHFFKLTVKTFDDCTYFNDRHIISFKRYIHQVNQVLGCIN